MPHWKGGTSQPDGILVVSGDARLRSILGIYRIRPDALWYLLVTEGYPGLGRRRPTMEASLRHG